MVFLQRIEYQYVMRAVISYLIKYVLRCCKVYPDVLSAAVF